MSQDDAVELRLAIAKHAIEREEVVVSIEASIELL
jgi:hypothetical protein